MIIDKPVQIFAQRHHITKLRQLENLQLLMQGMTSKEIADQLCLSDKTIKNQISTLCAKTKFKSSRQIMAAIYKVSLETKCTITE